MILVERKIVKMRMNSEKGKTLLHINYLPLILCTHSLPRVSGYADLSFPAPPLRQESDDSQLSSPLPSMASSIDTSGVNADVDREKDRVEMEVSPGKYAQLAEFQQEMKDKNTSDKM